MSELPPHPISAFSLALIVLATTTMLLWPALLLNHAPLIFSDTMDYLKMGIGPERPIRPRGYSWFAATPAWIAGSLWPVVILQSLITAALVHATLRVTLPKTGLRSHFCAGLGLSAFTTAPWSVSYVMPQQSPHFVWASDGMNESRGRCADEEWNRAGPIVVLF